MKINRPIVPCLWFDNEAEQAAYFYVSIFDDSSVKSVSRYGDEGKEFHGKEPGTALMVTFDLNGQSYSALNGGPHFKHSEAVSFIVSCDTQEEIDYFWNKLSEGGQESMCGWLKDKFGVSWQIVPSVLGQLMTDPARASRVMNAFLKMKKFDLQTLLDA
jgi:predicted 3-demethylubiquinone-9 3-methyltransferase (glyoxalase superfamily)